MSHHFNPQAPLLCRYKVTYVSGLVQYADIITKITMDLYDNGFLLWGNDKFQNLWIPHGAILDFKLSNGSAYDHGMFYTPNVMIHYVLEKIINIQYRVSAHESVFMKLEMKEHFYDTDNAKACEELIIIMKQNHIFEKFACAQPPKQQETPDIISQIERLGELHKAGILTDAEFESKKAELLKRL